MKPLQHQNIQKVIHTMQNNDPLWLAYLWETWGPTPERQRDLQALEDNVRAEGSWQKIDAFETARAKGKQAFKAKQELVQIYDKHGEKGARNWLDDAKDSWLSDQDIEETLRLEIKRKNRRAQSLRNRNSQSSQRSNVRAAFINGQHPNCLRAQKPATSWTIYVDETGSEFDATEDLDAKPKQVGRVVALAVPESVKLADCSDFHAVDRRFEEVDKVLQRILEAPIGILGFSIRDESARNRYWIGHVLHLVRWTLLQLPLPTDGGERRVRILIEQRGAYGPQTDIKAVAQALEGELAALDPLRFQGLMLEMGFMEKNHPMNGYVDVVAFTWGSTDRANKDRLRKSQLEGHCFINANERSLHHLFLALTKGGPLAPEDWYTLCAEASTEHTDSFLCRELDRLGATMPHHTRQWELYLAEVQMRLRSKQYSLNELGGAIAWLKMHAGQSQTIPGTLQLQLASSNLALSNHRGQINDDLVFNCLDLIQKLEDEAPQLVTEAILRMASTMANNFQFNALQEVVDKWLSKPIAAAGLLNYGKLQSTRGQMLAFSGDPVSAASWFKAASASFARLSDPRQAARETRQTQIYQIIALMDAVPLDPSQDKYAAEREAVTNALGQLFENRGATAISRSLAESGQLMRFEHDLWLRAITRFPAQFVEARAAYLDRFAQWQDGSDHPWPLILTYRAWLLRDADRTAEASIVMENAITTCLNSDHGGTLEWMALVLETLAKAIDVTVSGSSPAGELRLRNRLQNAPWQELADFSSEASQGPVPLTRVWAHLAKCLPFNFH